MCSLDACLELTFEVDQHEPSTTNALHNFKLLKAIQ